MPEMTRSIFRIVVCLILVRLIHSKSNSLHGNGDIILAGLVDVHLAIPGDNCGDIRPEGLASVAAFLYAIDAVNRDPTLLTNVTLGYDIHDTCGSAKRANQLAFSFVQRNEMLGSNTSQEESRGNSSTRSRKPVSAVITEIGSKSTLYVASMLQVRDIPLISADATSEKLNDPHFKAFFRTVPSDVQQARAIADLIEHFPEWEYVGIVAGDEAYGQYGAIALEDEVNKRQSFCIAFLEYVSSHHSRTNKLKQVLNYVKGNDRVQVIVLWMDLPTAAEFIDEANKAEVFGRTWIAPDGWSKAPQLLTDKYFRVVGGFLGTNFHSYDIPSFRHYVQNLSLSNGPLKDSGWWKELWNNASNCSHGGQCGNNALYPHLTDELYQRMHNPYLGYLIDAVYAAARAIDALCRHDNDLQCAGVKGADILAYLQNVSFKGITGEVRLDNKDDKSSAKYDILNLQRGPNATLVLKTVGSWDGGKVLERLVIRRDLLVWTNERRSVPESVCSLTCPPGTMQTTAVFCCWDCLQCTGIYVSRASGSMNCTRCAHDEKPNKEHTACEELPEIGLKWSDSVVIAITACAALGISIVTFVVITYLKFRATPVVKSSNPELSYCLMIGIILGFTSAIIALFPPNTVTCYVTHALYTLYINTCVSVLFLKTNRLLHIFQLAILSSAVTRWCCDRKNQFILLAILNLVPLSLLIVWLVFDPPEAIVTIVPMQYRYLDCKFFPQGVAGNILLMVFIYILIISIVCTCYAFKARKLPGNFNEAKFITFAMCIQLACVISFVTVGSLSDSYLVEFDCSIKLLSAFGFLVCIFAPKIYVIYRHPEKNTTEYVKSLVANHTLRSTKPSAVNVGPSTDRNSSLSAGSVMSAGTYCTSL